jgi:hypothetical protein
VSASGPPKRTGAPARRVDLTGCLLPWGADDQPVFLGMPESTLVYLPCFSSALILRATFALANTSFASIKHIDDGREFLASIPLKYVVILDPHFVDGGRVRFTRVLRD